MRPRRQRWGLIELESREQFDRRGAALDEEWVRPATWPLTSAICPVTMPASIGPRELRFSVPARHLLALFRMSAPRRVVPGTTYLVTRRCYQRTFRLRPSPETTHILAYCLGLAVEKTGILLHAVCFMSNHHHMVVTDPLGTLPDFLREVHRLTAKALNAAQGQSENLWSAEPCSAVQLADDEDIIDKISYVAANPVAAGPRRQWVGESATEKPTGALLLNRRHLATAGARSDSGTPPIAGFLKRICEIRRFGVESRLLTAAVCVPGRA
jgi:REP element-mobilizing transposase RayT